MEFLIRRSDEERCVEDFMVCPSASLLASLMVCMRLCVWTARARRRRGLPGEGKLRHQTNQDFMTMSSKGDNLTATVPTRGGSRGRSVPRHAASSSCEGSEEGCAGPSFDMATAYEVVNSDTSGSTTSRRSQLKLYELSSLEVFERARGWLEELDMIVDYAEFDESTAGRAHRRVECVRKAVSSLNRRAAMVEELRRDFEAMTDRMMEVESEMVDLRSRLRAANSEIAELRATERSVEEVPKEGLESAPDRLLRTMERLERKLSEHVQTCSESNAFERSCTPRDVDVSGPASEDARKAEPSRPNNGGADAESWSAVVGRRVRKGPGSGAGPSRSRRTLSASTPTGSKGQTETSVRGVGRVPRSPVVLVESLEEGVSSSDILRIVRGKVSPKDYNIKNIRCRETAKGGVLLDVRDPDATPDKVDALAGAIGSVLTGRVSVSRPTRRAEFRLRGIDPSSTVEELREAVAEAGGCSVAAVSVSGVRRLNSGHRVAWVCCPADVARSLSAGKCLTVGWSSAFIDLLHLKRVQCFRCWRFGHVRSACKAVTDRSDHCFRCGEAGHKAGGCAESLSCVLCKDGGMDYAHRCGSISCKSVDPPPRRGRR